MLNFNENEIIAITVTTSVDTSSSTVGIYLSGELVGSATGAAADTPFNIVIDLSLLSSIGSKEWEVIKDPALASFVVLQPNVNTGYPIVAVVNNIQQQV
jgi:hypothetical protein